MFFLSAEQKRLPRHFSPLVRKQRNKQTTSFLPTQTWDYPCLCDLFYGPFLFLFFLSLLFLFCVSKLQRPNSFLGKSTSVRACACLRECLAHRKKTKTIPPILKVTFSAQLFLPFWSSLPDNRTVPPPLSFSALFTSLCSLWSFTPSPFLNHTPRSSLIKRVNSSLTLLPSP